ncbi:MAG: hypothetical protein WCH43_00310 [Verrucomicrobiota bacterium]
MAKPNYSFEKRRKELANKAKKEEKRRRKLEGPAQTDLQPEEQTSGESDTVATTG